jgi:hypothetical protein
MYHHLPEAPCCSRHARFHLAAQEEHDYDYADGSQQVLAEPPPDSNERASRLHGTVYNR